MMKSTVSKSSMGSNEWVPGGKNIRGSREEKERIKRGRGEEEGGLHLA